MSLLSEDVSSPAVFLNAFHLTKAEGCPLILFFTVLSYVCDLVSVYSQGKGLGLGPMGPSVIPAAICTESSKIFSQFMRNKLQS